MVKKKKIKTEWVLNDCGLNRKVSGQQKRNMLRWFDQRGRKKIELQDKYMTEQCTGQDEGEE